MINYAQTPVAWALTRGMAHMLKVDLGKAAMDSDDARRPALVQAAQDFINQDLKNCMELQCRMGSWKIKNFQNL